jgi:hypothetical protein
MEQDITGTISSVNLTADKQWNFSGVVKANPILLIAFCIG